MKIGEEGQLLEFYERYLSAFHDLDAQKMNEFYEAPSIFVTDSETIILSDDATLKGFFQKMMEGLVDRGYSHTKIEDMNIKKISDSLVQMDGLAIRFVKDGNELERVGFTYFIRKADETWRFSVVVARPPVLQG